MFRRKNVQAGLDLPCRWFLLFIGCDGDQLLLVYDKESMEFGVLIICSRPIHAIPDLLKNYFHRENFFHPQGTLLAAIVRQCTLYFPAFDLFFAFEENPLAEKMKNKTFVFN